MLMVHFSRQTFIPFSCHTQVLHYGEDIHTHTHDGWSAHSQQCVSLSKQ